MQEEVTQKIITLVIKTAKLDANVLKAAMRMYLNHRRQKAEKTHGKTSVKKLVGEGVGVSSIEVTDDNIKSFEWVARKYNVDFAVKKDKTTDPPKYVVFFKGRDADAVAQAFKEFVYGNEKRKGGTSVREKLKESLSGISLLTSKIADKTLEQLENEGIFVFPEILRDADDITKDQMILQSVIIEDRNASKVEKSIDGYSGFLFFDDNGMPLVAMHWQHRFNHMVGRYNDIYRVQLPNITPHVCRHTYCSNMAKSGKNPKTLQYLMGHSDISVTMNVYTHIGFDDAEEELKRMEEFRKAQAEIEQKKEKPMSQKIFKVV